MNLKVTTIITLKAKDNKHKRIHVVHLIDSLGPGGAQEVVRLIVKKSIPEGIRHTVIVLTRKEPYYEQGILQTGTEIIYLSQFWRIGFVLIIPLLIGRLRHYLKGIQPSVIHFHLPGAMVVGCLATLGLKIGKILTVYAWENQLPFWVYPVLQLLTPLIDKIHCANGSQFPWVSKHKLIETSAGIDVEMELNPSQKHLLEEFNINGKSPLLFSIGRFHPDKGHDLAIQVLGIVQKVLPDAVLFIIGIGEFSEEKRLKELAKHLHLSGSVIFTGYRTDLTSFLVLGGFFIRGSVNECGNMSQVLAQYCGLVPIGFDVSSVIKTQFDFIQNNLTGKLVPLKDIRRMAEEIIHIWNHPQTYQQMRERSKEWVKKHHDIRKTHIEPLIQIYDQLSEAKREIK